MVTSEIPNFSMSHFSVDYRMNSRIALSLIVCLTFGVSALRAQVQPRPVVPPEKRGRIDAERSGFHDANNIRTVFYNYGMVGDYPSDPGNVDLSVFHSVEVPKGSGLDYSDGGTPYVLARIVQTNSIPAYIMETGYRERQATNFSGRMIRYEPRPGYFQADPTINRGRSPAISNDPRTWPSVWPDRLSDTTDPGWGGSWDGYFGKRPAADEESFFALDDNLYSGWLFNPDSRDTTRRGLAFAMEVRGFQWSNPQAGNVIFFHYDVVNEGMTDYNNNLFFGIYFDSGVGGSALSCDGVYESDDDNAYFDKSFGLNLTYTWDTYGHGVGLNSTCERTGYLGYAYLETPGNPYDGVDNDQDGITDERRDGGPGTLITGAANILAYVNSHYNVSLFEQYYGPISSRPAYKEEYWWTGDENMDWTREFDDTGVDGVMGTHDQGEGDGIPTEGETNFDRTDVDESDQIGLTGFKMNRIRAGGTNPSAETDNIVFYDDGVKNWPKLLYDQFSNSTEALRFDQPVVLNYNIAFLFTSGPFRLEHWTQERFSLSLVYASDLYELRRTIKVLQKIYASNYQFVVPPTLPTLTADAGDGYVRLTWDDKAERSVDPVTHKLDFEGYKIYRSTDPVFRDAQVVTDARGTGPFGNGRPIVQFDAINEYTGFSDINVEGISYYYGSNTGITHTFIDTTVTNGQDYFYAVCAYDHGDSSLGFYPSENSIVVSRTPRGGTILARNVVEVRPNPKALGYTPANLSSVSRVSGTGVGSVDVRVVNPNDVPDNSTLQVRFATSIPQNIHADYYELVDSASGKVYVERGSDFDATGNGAVGAGIVPLVETPPAPLIDTVWSGFRPGSPTNIRLKLSYFGNPPAGLSSNLRRLGYPDSLSIEFSDVTVDTSLLAFGFPRREMKFRVFALTDTGKYQLKYQVKDLDFDGTLSSDLEFGYICTMNPSDTLHIQHPTWYFGLDTVGQAARGPIIPPTAGDVYVLKLLKPFSDGDVFSFRTTGQRVDVAQAVRDGQFDPYVVPNPYVGAASFEPERFAVSGRGERRIEFRGLPSTCTIRIYTIRGDLVRTIHHEGTLTGYEAWDLRTKDNLEVAPGLYIFHVDAGPIGTKIGKFSIIK